MDKPLDIFELEQTMRYNKQVKFHKECVERYSIIGLTRKNLMIMYIIKNLTNNSYNVHTVRAEGITARYNIEIIYSGHSVLDTNIPVFICAEESLKAQDNIFCACNNRKCKRILISNSLQYDFCENCKKEIKGELTNA